jgi:hypothetical protein
MNPLRTLETKIASLVEGAFGRAFRAEVRPMEIARKLTREMDEHRTSSVSRVYAPNEYAVWLSPADRARYEGVEEDLIEELCAYLLEHARREELTLTSPPLIVFHTDEALALGEFGIQASLVRPEDRAAGLPTPEREAHDHAHDADERTDPDEWGEMTGSSEGHGETMVYSGSERVRGAVEEARAQRSSRALMVVGGRRLLVPPRGAVVGRSRECEIVLEDEGISRRHFEVRPTPEGWTLADLGSTNGTRLNGRAIRGSEALQTGDRIRAGSTEISFEVR